MKEYLSPNDLSKLLNMPAANIRFYENRGLISPRRVEGSTYRQYTVSDIERLCTCCYWMNYGFTISEIADMVGKIAFEDLSRLLEERTHDMEASIALSQIHLNRMQFILKDHELLREHEGEYSIQHRPGGIHYSLTKGNNVLISITKSKTFEKISNHFHMFEMASYIPLEYACSDELFEEKRIGFLCRQQHIDRFHLADITDDNATFLPRSTCVTVPLFVDQIEPSVLKRIFKWIDDHNFEPCGGILARSIGTLFCDGKKCYEFRVPIKDKVPKVNG